MARTSKPNSSKNTLHLTQQCLIEYCRTGISRFLADLRDTINQQLLITNLHDRSALLATLKVTENDSEGLRSNYILHDALAETFTHAGQRVNLNRPETLSRAENLTLETKLTTEINTLLTSATEKQNHLHNGPLFALKLRRESLLSARRQADASTKGSTDNAALPFTPEELSEPFRKWLEQLDVPDQGKPVLAQRFAEAFFAELDQLYDELNQIFIDAGVLPNFKPKSRKSNSTDQAHKDNVRSTEYTDEQAANDRITQSGLFESYQRQAQWHNQLAPNPAQRRQIIDQTQPALSKNQLINLINEQEQLLQDPIQLSSALRGLNSNVRETQYALDCVDYFLDTLEEDKSLAPHLKTALTSIHAPMMRLALIDESFLSNPQHVARELIETIVDYCEFWEEDSPRAPHNNAIETNVQRILEHIRTITPIEDPGNRSFYREELEIFAQRLQELERRAELSIRRQEERFIGEQKIIEKRFVAEAFIQHRTTRKKIPRPVINFLNEEWLEVLVFALIQDNAQQDRSDGIPSYWNLYSPVVLEILEMIKPVPEPDNHPYDEARRNKLLTTVSRGLRDIGLANSQISELTGMLEACAKLAQDHAKQLLEEPPARDKSETQQELSSSRGNLFADVTEPLPENSGQAQTSALKQIRRLDAGSYLKMQTSAGNWALLKVIQTNLKTNAMLVSTRNGIRVGNYQFAELAAMLKQKKLKIVSEHSMDMPVFERMFARLAQSSQAREASEAEREH